MLHDSVAHEVQGSIVLHSTTSDRHNNR